MNEVGAKTFFILRLLFNQIFLTEKVRSGQGIPQMSTEKECNNDFAASCETRTLGNKNVKIKNLQKSYIV